VKQFTGKEFSIAHTYLKSVQSSSAQKMQKEKKHHKEMPGNLSKI
jgi:hypothetical protein